MPKYHINPKTGNPGLCTAKNQCPFGDLDRDHYSTRESALTAYEKNQSHQLLPVQGKQKSAPLSSQELLDRAGTHVLEILENETYNHDELKIFSQSWAEDYRRSLTSQEMEAVKKISPTGQAEFLDYLNYQASSKGFNKELHTLSALFRKTTPNAVVPELHTLSELRQMSSQMKNPVMVISDVHGSVDLLDTTLQRLGVIDSGGNRLNPNVHLLSIGDLVDGRNPQDGETLERANNWFDTVLVGNHEAAILGYGHFDGLDKKDPELVGLLREQIYEGRIKLAHNAHGTLLTHAGVSGQSPYPDIDTAEYYLNKEWERTTLAPGHLPRELFALDRHRGGGSAQGGALWQDWRGLLESPTDYSQIVGHSPLGSPETNPSGRVACIDQGGERLGVALLGEEETHFGSSLVARS